MNLLENNVRGTLASGIDGVATSMTVTLDGNSKSYPATPSADTPMYLTISSPDDPLLNEIVKVTAVSGANVTTMVRAQRDTVALAWATGSVVSLNLHEQDITQFWPASTYAISAKPSPLAVTVPDKTYFVPIVFSANNDTMTLTLATGEACTGDSVVVFVNISDDGGTATKLDIDTGAIFGTETSVANGTYMYRCLEAGEWAPYRDLFAVTPITGVSLDAAAGSEAAPSLTLSDAGSGFFRNAENEISASINSTLVLTISSTGLSVVDTLSADSVEAGTITATDVITAIAGSAAAPSLNFGTADTGIYGSAAGVFFAVGGARIAGVSATALDVPAGSEAVPSLNFGTADTGLFGDADTVSITQNGSTVVTFGADTTFRCSPDFVENDAAQVSVYSYNAATAHSRINLWCARGTEASPGSLLDGDYVGGIFGRSWGTGETFNISAAIRFQATENHSNTACGSKIIFYTTENTTTTYGAALELDEDKTVRTYGDEVMLSTAAKYFGGSAVNGSWRVVRDSDDLIFERRESGSWVEKFAIED